MAVRQATPPAGDSPKPRHRPDARPAVSRLALCAALLIAGCHQEVAAPVLPDLSAADERLRTFLVRLHAGAVGAPESAELRGRLAMAYDVNEFDQAAIVSYEQTESLDPTNFSWPYYRALLLGKGGDFPRALAALDRAEAIDKTYVPLWLWRGEWLRELRRLQEANEAYDRADAAGAHSLAQAGRAQILLDQDQAADALAILEPLNKEHPHPHHERMLGQTYRMLGRAEDARIAMARGRDAAPLRWFDPRLEKRRQYIEGYSGRLRYAQALVRGGQPQDALRVIEPLREAHATDPALVGTLAWAYNAGDQTDHALEVLKAALAANPEHARYHRHLANVYQKRGDKKRQRQHLSLLLQANIADPWVHKELALLATQEGRYDEAIASYDAALRHGAASPANMHHAVGLIEGKRERWDAAIARFEKVVAIDESFTIGYIYLGRCLAEAGRFDEARERFAWAEKLGTHPAKLADARVRLRKIESGAP